MIIILKYLKQNLFDIIELLKIIKFFENIKFKNIEKYKIY